VRPIPQVEPMTAAPELKPGPAGSPRRWWLLPPVAAACWIPLMLALDPSSRTRALTVGNAAMCALAVAGLRWHRPSNGRAWWLLAVGNICAVAAGVLEQAGGDVASVTGGPVAASLAGVLYLTGYSLIIVGYLRLLKQRSGHRDATRQLDALIFAAAAMLLMWTFLLRPLLANVPVDSPEWWLLVIIPSLDLLIAFLLFRLLLLPTGGNLTIHLIAGAMAAVVLADVARVILTGTGGDETLSLVGYLVGLALWASAMLHPHLRWAGARAVVDDDKPGSVRLLFLAAAAAVAPGVYAVHRLSGRDGEELDGIVLIAFLLYALFVARLRVTVRDLDRSKARIARTADREQILSRTGRALMAAHSRPAALQLCADGAAELTGVTGARILTGPPEGGDGWGVPLKETDPRGPSLWLPEATPPNREVRQALAFLAASTAVRLDAIDAADSVQASEARFRSVVQHANDGIVLTDGDGYFTYASPSCQQLLGVPPSDLVGNSAFLLFDDEQELARAQALLVELLDRPRDPIDAEFTIPHPDGRPRTLAATYTNLLDEPGVNSIVGNFRDVTDEQAMKATMRHRAETDELTGLANRRVLQERIAQLCQRHDAPFAVLLLDLDDFKSVNDTLGHDAGDRLLITMAHRLQDELRGPDLVCRLGGDEFAVVLSGLSHPEEATEVAARLVQAVCQPTTIGGNSVRPGASVGIALSSDVVPSAETLLGSADLALYAAKRAGKSIWCRYTPGMREEAVARVSMRRDLERALLADEIIPLYQPLVDMRDGRVVGAEALVRWRRPDGALQSPAGFLPLAEETGLITALDARVLRQACVDAAEWVAADPSFMVTVNVSGRELGSLGFSDGVLTTLTDTGLAPQNLILEVTETSFMAAVDQARANLKALRDQGVRLAIDDFGTGYSSLGRLSTLPVDVLKIDRSFVDGVDGGPESAAIAKAIVRLAATLRLQTIAEGIERETQATALTGMRCTIGQGFLYAHPMPRSQLTTLLAEQAT
jgi:diguanylate cyclase (GGDEF)-like protein/PAS domain S-box-containing protein